MTPEKSGPLIIVYYRPFCPWAREVLSFLKEKGLAFTEKNLSSDPALVEEMQRRTGQEQSPCVEIDGVMLADVGREEIESYMTANGLIKDN